MKLKTVTITGADDQTNPGALCSLSEKYPFVEWGLLLSKTATGNNPRFPCLATLQTIGGLPIRTSVHLCGQLARNVANSKGYPLETAIELVPNARRIQINTGDLLKAYPNLFSLLVLDSLRFRMQMILQAYRFDTPAVLNALYGVMRVSTPDDLGCVMLHDASGGRGIDGEFERPAHPHFVGFAGGITPDNIERKLAQIDALSLPNPFWIDIESGVRTNDCFDLKKVETILRVASRYIQPQQEKGSVAS